MNGMVRARVHLELVNTRSVERVIEDGDKYANLHSFRLSIDYKLFLVILLTSA